VNVDLWIARKLSECFGFHALFDVFHPGTAVFSADLPDKHAKSVTRSVREHNPLRVASIRYRGQTPPLSSPARKPSLILRVESVGVHRWELVELCQYRTAIAVQIGPCSIGRRFSRRLRVSCAA
jgi:hypothetical protein